MEAAPSLFSGAIFRQRERIIIMNVKEAAAWLGISVSLCYSLCEEKRLPHRRYGRQGKRGKIVIREEDLKSFEKGAKVEAEGAA